MGVGGRILKTRSGIREEVEGGLSEFQPLTAEGTLALGNRDAISYIVLC